MKSEVFRRSPKTSEVFLSLRTCINASEIVIYSFYTWFLFFTWVWVKIFLENCVKQDSNNSHFSIRHEKLARMGEPAWDRSFQPAGVRLTPKAWELAGILITFWKLQVNSHNSLWLCSLNSIFRDPKMIRTLRLRGHEKSMNSFYFKTLGVLSLIASCISFNIII